MMTVAEMLTRTTRELKDGGIPGPRLDAEVLLAHVLCVERYRLSTDDRRILDDVQEKQYRKMIDRRLCFEPVAYITGTREFYGLEFHVTPDVLIPRPETELVVDMAVFYAMRCARVLDIGTGSGAIAVALGHARNDLEITATDISEAALDIARGNCRDILGEGEIEFLAGNIFEPVRDRTFHLIVSNPPYIDPAREGHLQKDLSFEPRQALYASDQGRAVVDSLIRGAGPYLEPGGMMILEIGEDMRDHVLSLARAEGYNASALNDNAGLPRVALLKL